MPSDTLDLPTILSDPVADPRPEDYASLLDYLSDASVRWFAPAGYRCALEEDPDWPAPTNQPEIGDLIRRLPDVAAFVCGLTAAEMALPLWEEYAQFQLPWAVPATLHHTHLQGGRHLPARAVEAANLYLRGEVAFEEVQQQGDHVLRMAQNPELPYGSVGYNAAFATVLAHQPQFLPYYAARAYARTRDDLHRLEAEEELEAIRQRSHASPRIQQYLEEHEEAILGKIVNRLYTRDFEEFLRRWWEICRCRLAFRIGEESDILL